MTESRHRLRMMRAPFVLVYLIPALVLFYRYWPWNTATVPDATFIAIGLGGIAMLLVLFVFLLPRVMVSLGTTTQVARRWRYAAGDAVIGPLLLILYLTASKFIHSLGVFLVAAVALTVLVVIGAEFTKRKNFPNF